MKPPVPRTRAEHIFCSHGIDREEWSEWRSQQCSVGASTAPSLLGINRYEGAYTAVKVLRGDVPPPDLSDKWAVKLGVMLEPYVLQAVVEHRRPDWVLKPGCYTFRHPDHQWATATPDAFLETPGELDLPIEVKVTRKFQPWELFALSGLNPDAVKGTMVYSYWAQVQHQLWVTGAPLGYLIGACGRDLHCHLMMGEGLERSIQDLYIFEIKRDQAWIDRSFDLLNWMWFHCVNGDQEPEAKATDFKAIARCARFEHANLMPDGEKHRELIVAYQAAAQEKKDATENLTNISAEIKRVIGSYLGMEVEPGFIVKNSKPDKNGNRRLTLSQRKLGEPTKE